MSTYQYTSGDDLLAAGQSLAQKNTCVMEITDLEGSASIYIPNADIPAVAVGLLKAAGQECVIIPKDPVESIINTVIKAGLIDRFNTAPAIAEYLDGKAAEKKANAAMEAAAKLEAAEKKLQERRDAIKTELVKAVLNCDGPTNIVRTAIDRIIELEDGAARD